MTIKVLFFASLAAQLDRREMALQIPEGATVHDAFLLLAKQFSDLSGIESRLAFAVNMTYVKGEHLLADGDELAMIPPVSGG
jgi:molybdopterin converting factor subunit 1